jgi:hypothetical protein
MWDWAVWGALVVAICSGIFGIVVVLTRVREALRHAKSVHSRAVESLGVLAAKAELAATKAEAAGDTHELRASVARLRRSLTRLGILRAALARADAQLGWLRVLL